MVRSFVENERIGGLKAKLIFNLPEENREFHYAIHGIDYSMALDNIDNMLRAHLKYDENPHWDTDTVEEIREKLGEICSEIGER